MWNKPSHIFTLTYCCIEFEGNKVYSPSSRWALDVMPPRCDVLLSDVSGFILEVLGLLFW